MESNSVDWTVNLLLPTIVGVAVAVISVLLTTPYVIRKAVMAESENQLRVERGTFVRGLNILRFETAANQSVARLNPAGIRNDAAHALLSSGAVFKFDRPDLAYLITVYLSEAEMLRAGSGVVDRYVEFTHLLQGELDSATESAPVSRTEMESVFERVRQIVEKYQSQ